MARKQQDKPETEETQTPESDATGKPEATDDAIHTGSADEATTETPETLLDAGADSPDGDPHDHVHDSAEYQDADHHEIEHHDSYLEEHGIFPMWLKVMLVLLLGAGIALWGGPRLAPLLPSGMAPVARFLTPGGVQQAAEIDARLSALEQQQQPTSPVPEDAIDVAVQAALADYDSAVRADLEPLRDKVAAIDASDIEARLTRVETAVDGLEAQMKSLGERLTTAVSEGIDQQTAQSAEQAAAYQATLDRLSAQIDSLSARQGNLQQNIDEVAATNTRIKEEAESVVGASQAAKAATDIAVALETGAPFRSALDTLAGVVDTDLPALQAAADSGVRSLPALKADFAALAHEALRASIRAEADGYTGKALAFLRSQVATRSLTPQPGNGTDAILSRIDAALDAGDLAVVLDEAQALNDAARAPLADWLASVRNLSGALADLSAATAQIPRQKS